MNIKLDIKSFLILILLTGCVFFGSLWYLKGTDYKNKIKESNIKIEKIEHVRDSLKLSNKKLESDFLKLEKRISDRENDIKKIEKELLKTKEDLKKSKEEVEKNKKILTDSKKRIDNLKKNPIKREEDELLKSLKEKLK